MILRALFVLPIVVGAVADPTRCSVGHEFLLAFFPHASRYDPTSESILHITSKTSGHCVIGFSEGQHTYMYAEIDENETTEITIPSSAWVPSQIVTTSNKAIRVICTVPVSLYASYRSPNNHPSSAMVILPVSSLAKEYYVPGFPGNGFVGIVSTKDNSITVHLNKTCKHPNNQLLYNSRENQTQTMYEDDVVFISVKDCDLGGTYVVAEHPIAVFSGSMEIQYGGAHETDDVTSMQVLPFHMWGTEFIVNVPAGLAGGKLVARILVQNMTTLIRLSENGSSMKDIFRDQNKGLYDINMPAQKETYTLRSSSPVSITIITSGSAGTTYSPLPSTSLYQKEALVPDFGPETSLVVTSISHDDIRINKRVFTGMKHAGTSPNLVYSVGTFQTEMGIYAYLINYRTGHGTFDARVYGRSNAEFAVNAGYGTYIPSAGSLDFSDYWDSKVNLSCDHGSWAITVDTASRSFSPVVTNLTLGGTCVGLKSRRKLEFSASFNECGTTKELYGDRIIYKNFLTFRELWRMNVVCFLKSSSQPTPSGKIIASYTQTVVKPIVHIKLFSDKDFKQEIRGSQGLVSGKTIYAEVSGPANMGLKMVIKRCNTLSRIQIYDRCAVDRYTKILSTTNHVTRFSFIDPRTPVGEIRNLYCDVHFCKTDDQSIQCEEKCPRDYGPVIGK